MKGDLPPDELFARLKSEFDRVGTGVDALVEIDRLNAGPPPPGVPAPPEDSVNWDITGFRMALEVLQSLSDRAGKQAFVTSFIKRVERGFDDAGA